MVGEGMTAWLWDWQLEVLGEIGCYFGGFGLVDDEIESVIVLLFALKIFSA